MNDTQHYSLNQFLTQDRSFTKSQITQFQFELGAWISNESQNDLSFGHKMARGYSKTSINGEQFLK